MAQFSWTSEYDALAGDAVLYLQNASADKILQVRRIRLGADGDNRFHVDIVTGTPSGDVISARRLSRISRRTVDASDYNAMGNAATTGLTPVAVLERVRVGQHTNIPAEYEPEKFELGENDALAVYAQDSGKIDVTIIAEFT